MNSLEGWPLCDLSSIHFLYVVLSQLLFIQELSNLGLVTLSSVYLNACFKATFLMYKSPLSHTQDDPFCGEVTLIDEHLCIT